LLHGTNEASINLHGTASRLLPIRSGNHIILFRKLLKHNIGSRKISRKVEPVIGSIIKT